MVLFCLLNRRRINAKHHRIIKQFTKGFLTVDDPVFLTELARLFRAPRGKSSNRRGQAPLFFQLSFKE